MITTTTMIATMNTACVYAKGTVQRKQNKNITYTNFVNTRHETKTILIMSMSLSMSIVNL